jgi:hypothetical protein
MNHQTKKETKEQFSNGHEKKTRQDYVAFFISCNKQFHRRFYAAKGKV